RSVTVREPLRFAPPTPPHPAADFAAWLAAARRCPTPEAQLASLRDWRDHAGVVRGALLHLARTLQGGGADWEARVFAIAAVARLQAQAARPVLTAVARREAEALAGHPDLPSPEAALALAALATLAWSEPFEAGEVFARYLAEVETVEAAEDPESARRSAAKRFIWRLEALQAPVEAPRPAAPTAPVMIRQRVGVAPQPFAPTPTPRVEASHRLRRAGAESWAQAAEDTRVHTGLWLVGPAGHLPWPVPAAALIAACAALMGFVVGAKLGGLFGPLAVLAAGAAVGLFADRRWAWLGGLAALGVSGVHLLVASTGALPQWLSPSALALAGLVTLGGVGLLLQPEVRQRYRKVRWG
ncbi:MAG: hypothetical protein KC613_25340, partial [Myxococcales bacterium]|nr:hypothetical protein [Myxococcales bacterium]